MTEQANLEIVERSDDGVAARLTGDLDIVNAEDVKRELTEVFDAGPTALTLDMGNVRFVDSSGLGTLVAVHRHAEAAGLVCQLTVPAPSAGNSSAWTWPASVTSTTVPLGTPRTRSVAVTVRSAATASRSPMPAVR